MCELSPKQSKPFEIKEKWHSSKVVSHWKRLLINCAFGVTPRKDFRLRLRERCEKVARSFLLSPISPWAEKKNGASEPSNLTKVMR